MATFIDAHDRVDEEFSALMQRLAAPYQTARLSSDGIKVYARVLSRAGLTLDQVRSMFGRALTECKYFPSIAELMKFVKPDAEDAAMLAWARLEQLAETKGAYEDISLDDGLDVAALTALMMIFGSWPLFCDAEDGPLLNRKRQEFLIAYRQTRLHATGVRSAPGLCSMTNQQKPAPELRAMDTTRSLIGAGAKE